MINTIKEDELGIIILCFSCLHSQNIQLQNIQFSFICLKFFDSCLQRLCVLQYHAHVTFIRQSWIHFNLVSVSDAAFNLRFLRWWKCISFKWLVELKKKKLSWRFWQTSRSASLTQFNPRFDKLLYRKAVFWRRNGLPARASTPGEGNAPAAWPLRLHLQEQKGLFSFSTVNFPPANQNASCLADWNTLQPGKAAPLFTTNLCPGRSQ